MAKSNIQQFLIPGAIIIAGGLIALSVVMGGGGNDSVAVGGHGGGNTFENANSASGANVKPVDENDHVRGARDAKVSLIEFSDFECPFCARLHPTMRQILEEFDGEVNWVYRHLPLAQIHAQAEGSAIASECIARVGGNDEFWEFTDRVFANQRGLNPSFYESVAADLGVNLDEYSSCINDSSVADLVREDLIDAQRSGGRGTPYVVVVAEDGSTFPFSGALPYEQVRGIVSNALLQGEG